MKSKKEKRQEMYLQITMLVTFSILLGVLLITFLISLNTNTSFHERPNYAPSIYTNDLSDSERLAIERLIDSLKEDYALTLDELYFTKNQTFIDELCETSCYGINKKSVENGEIKSKIYVYFDGNYPRVRRTLCHEISHNFLKSEEYYHKFAYDLASEGVCYASL